MFRGGQNCPPPRTKLPPIIDSSIEIQEVKDIRDPQAESLCVSFYQSLKENRPEHTPSKLKVKPADLKAMLVLIKLWGEDRIKQVIKYAHSGYWITHVHSVSYLSRKWDTIEAQLKSKETPTTSKATPFERMKQIFNNGEHYNGAECALTEQGICFMRGTRAADVKFDKFFSWKRVEDLCKSFGIQVQVPT